MLTAQLEIQPLLSLRYSMSSMEHIYISMVFVFRAKSKHHEKSNTELELFELAITQHIMNGLR